MKYEIYQIDNEMTREYGFRRFDDLMADVGGVLPKPIYNKVYEGEIEEQTEKCWVLEDIFRKFNRDIPADFKGHSLSMGDVVVLEGVPFYCDYAGFKKVSAWY